MKMNVQQFNLFHRCSQTVSVLIVFNYRDVPYTLRVIQKTFLLVLHVTEITCVFAVAHIAARAQSYTNLLTFKKVKKSQLMKPQGQTFYGLRSLPQLFV